MLHARPHLQTHKRVQGHSSVAGAAYRLGLKLYDRRTKRTYDFRHREAGEEIVFQTTVAPKGAPEWATDPEELWNRVEASEIRTNSQVARDYRIPLPLGLSDKEAQAMAMEMAMYIVAKLVTPVSIGVHRDAAVSALGEDKAPGEIGCHAHIYFPTRPVLLDGEAVQDGKSGGTGMGKKFAFLTRTATSGLFVEDLNQVWAALANRYVAAAGRTADYDHRSYRRMGVPLKPQARLGQAASMLERKGVRTRKGQAAREVAAMSEIYRRVHGKRQAKV